MFDWYRRQTDPEGHLGRILWYEVWRIIIHALGFVVYGMRHIGKENFPKSGPVLLVCNHQSNLDPPLISTVTRRNMHFLARQTLFKGPVFSFIARSLNAIPMDQEKGDTAAIKLALEHLRKGRVVLIFAEGARTHDGALNEFKPGAALLIKRAKAPVVPVAIEGAFDVWSRFDSKPSIKGRIWVKVDPAIPYEEFKSMKGPEMLERIKSQIDDMRLDLRRQIRYTTYDKFPPPGPGDHRYDDPDAPARELSPEQKLAAEAEAAAPEATSSTASQPDAIPTSS